MAKKEVKGFQTEIKALLNLVIHSLYSNKDIFLRELISNASDALDKLRFQALDDGSLFEQDPDLGIWVEINAEQKTLHIRDNGIGMSREEVEHNLGTIAHSGTRAFLDKMGQDKQDASQLIGQFGVGFYSAFIVAHEVVVRTRRAGLSAHEGVQWSSQGEGEYTIESCEQAPRGTEIILHLKESDHDYLEPWKIRQILTKYSDHINWPIRMPTIQGSEEVTKHENPSWDVVNRTTAIWTLPKSEIKESDYHDLYRHISHDTKAPLTWSHNRVEGKQQYVSLLYIPQKAPLNIAYRDQKHGLKLYVQRVFIMDDADQFLPQYLRFSRGIIDSSDLPLNISREILQSNPLVEQIKQATIKRVLSMLAKLAQDDAQSYQTFWKEFGMVLKEGIVEDRNNQEKVAQLLRFSSTHLDDEAQTVGLDDYLERMKPDQDKIYYLKANSYKTAISSPHLESFKKSGLEVLLLTDTIDEWLSHHLTEYKGKKLQSVNQGQTDLPHIEISSEKTSMMEPAMERMKAILAHQVKDIRLSHRLTESAACLVADEHDMSQEMQRILKASGQPIPEVLPVLELNPEHPMVQKLKTETIDSRFADWCHLLYEQAFLSEGGQLEDPVAFVKRMNHMLFSSSIVLTA